MDIRKELLVRQTTGAVVVELTREHGRELLVKRDEVLSVLAALELVLHIIPVRYQSIREYTNDTHGLEQ